MSIPKESGILTCIRVKDTPEALALARSAALHSPAVGRAVAVEGALSSDQEAALRDCYEHLIPMRSEHFRLGWQAKNVAHEYSPFERTLFLDADCLVMRDLQPVFDRFRGKPVAFSAKPEPAQETGASLFAKVSLAGLLAHFQIDWWPQILGGGHFYFERGAKATELFASARGWANLDRLRPFGWDQPNVSDELTLQFALVEAGLARQCTVCDLPFVLWTPSVGADPDVMTGRVEGRRPDEGRFSTDEFHVMHFGGDHENVFYRRERYRLAWHRHAVRKPGSVAALCQPWANSQPLVGAIAYTLLKASRLPGRLQRVVRGLSPGPAVAPAQS